MSNEIYPDTSVATVNLDRVPLTEGSPVSYTVTVTGETGTIVHTEILNLPAECTEYDDERALVQFLSFDFDNNGGAFGGETPALQFAFWQIHPAWECDDLLIDAQRVDNVEGFEIYSRVWNIQSTADGIEYELSITEKVLA